ncbi:RHS repeat domain-containing protein [Saccharibacillus kuerlensis]|uniref:YD repeat-containing protein n=1 Tax=Saccharibacillus kuerlensis TaxID=459527 RepID=A0ABQ2L412_9BACL|nr:RHS repeat domain-containing protein [Saccharibacillus kuerlensis]GGO00254.1 hypothetical protein GCM10010969_21240 [Saccharibacillus kuerlensis]
MKLGTKKSTAVILVFSMLTVVGSTIYAADYQYDSLNRVTSVEKEGKTTNYTYDQGGNLLSATSTSATSIQQTNIIAGWTPFMTQGMSPYYETEALNENGDLASNDSVSVTDSTYGESASTAAVQFITLNADRTGVANIYRDMAVQGDVGYTYQGQVKTEQMKDAAVQVVVNYYDEQNRLIKYDNLLNVKQDTDWKSYHTNLIAPPQAVTARIHLQVVLLEANGQAKAGFVDRTFKQAASQGGQ